jgi:hypothetical protein
MSTIKPTRVQRVNSPYSLTDPKPHIDFITTMMNHPAGTQPNELYGWIGTSEDARLWWQNNHRMDHNINWGDRHFNYNVFLQEHGVVPKKIATVGVGKDASLVENLVTIFPNAAITVIEQGLSNIASARQTLETDGVPIDHITFEQGEAATILFQHPGKFDLIDVQLLIQHLAQQPPAIWDESRQGIFPTFGRMMQAFETALAPGGYLMAADMTIMGWDHQAAAGYETDAQVQALLAEARRYVYGDNGTPLGAINLGWRARAASAFATPEEIVNTITQYAPKLQPVADWRMSEEQQIFQQGNAHIVTVMYIPLTLREATNSALQLHKVIAASPSPKADAAKTAIPRLEGAVNWLSIQGKRYLEVITDPRIQGIFPRLHWQTLRKVD